MKLFGSERAKAERGNAAELQPQPIAPLSNPLGLPEFLARLAAGDRDRLSSAAITVSAKRLGVAPAVLSTVVEIEAAGRAGFGANGLPFITFEPSAFSRLTGGRHDRANPDISYPVADARRLPAAQDLRWKQLAKAFVMDREAALKATSWGMFAMPGEDHAAHGFATAADMALSLAASEEGQLEALEQRVRLGGAEASLRARDWASYARSRDDGDARALAARLYRTHKRLTDRKRRFL